MCSVANFIFSLYLQLNQWCVGWHLIHQQECGKLTRRVKVILFSFVEQTVKMRGYKCVHCGKAWESDWLPEGLEVDGVMGFDDTLYFCGKTCKWNWTVKQFNVVEVEIDKSVLSNKRQKI